MRKALSFIFVLLFSTVAYSQSADVITAILESENLTYGQAAYLSATHQGFIHDNSSYEDAVKALDSVGQISSKAVADSPIKYQDLAEIYLQMWPEIKAGLMYRITKGSPRYAFKKLKSDGIIGERADPSKTLSGWEALNILSACMSEYGSADELMDMDMDKSYENEAGN